MAERHEHRRILDVLASLDAGVFQRAEDVIDLILLEHVLGELPQAA